MASRDQHFLFLLAADRPLATRIVAFMLGCMMTLVFAPMELAYLAPLLLLPLFFVTLTVSPRDAGSHYFWFGLGLFLTGTYWIYISVHVFGQAALWIAILLMVGLALIMATFLRVAGWLTGRLTQGEPWQLLLAAPAAWVLIEWLRGWFLSGFPWLALGYSQLETGFAGWAPLAGVYAVSYMLATSAAGLLVFLLVRGRQRLVAALFVLLPLLVGLLLMRVQWTESYGEPIRTTIVQAGVPQDQKWEPSQRQRTLEFYRAATIKVPRSDLVVWPEVSIPAVTDQVENYLAALSAVASRRRQTVVLGILERRGEAGRIYNSVLTLGTRERQSYRKRHLVPFGEYFPVPERVRQWMKMQNLPYADLAAGDAVQPLLQTHRGHKLSVAICYEDAYAAEQMYAFPESDLIVNVSNDAWFGDSIAPHQHLQIARMRALEFGRFAVRSTNNGISAFIGPDGRLLRAGRQFVAETMTADLHARRGETPFSNVGNWPVVGTSIFMLCLIWLRSRVGI